MKNLPGPLPESTSLLLDFIRLGAAVLVLIAHMSHPEFKLGYFNWQILGDIAVPVFFVLSGFVIRFVARTRESNARHYFIDRASRMYSVVLPAMAFNLLAGLACFLLDRGQFIRDGWIKTFDHPVVRLAANLVFFSQAWGHDTFPFLDSPFWSLGYECVYYVLFGLIFFLRGWRRYVPCAVIAVIIGPQVMFLFPVWWLGCLVYEFYVRFRKTRVSSVILASTAAWLVIAGALSLMGRSELLQAPLVAFQWVASLRHPIEMMGLMAKRATMFAVATGIFTSLALIPLLFATDHITISANGRAVKGFRTVANATFVIYLVHYPMLVLLLFLNLLKPQQLWSNILVGIAMCIVMIFAAIPMDWFKNKLRNWLRTVLPGGERSLQRHDVPA
jgi:peptidoglycan/LPS O-acetylase OafA/YrhL